MVSDRRKEQVTRDRARTSGGINLQIHTGCLQVVGGLTDDFFLTLWDLLDLFYS